MSSEKEASSARPAVGTTTSSIGSNSVSSNYSGSPWKLPDGIEEHLEAGLIKAAVGVAVGGAVGLLLFRAGQGGRATAVAAGFGVAVGSTAARVSGYSDNNIYGGTVVTLDGTRRPRGATAATTTTTRGVVQTFPTEPPPTPGGASRPRGGTAEADKE